MIRHALIDEKRKTYEWMCLSDTAAAHMGGADYEENPIPSWEEFQEAFEDFYYTESRKESGAVMIIQNGDTEVGCTCYACFHLNSNMAELDIWLKSESECGKGIGSQALKDTIEYLRKKIGITNFLIRPSEKNIRAIKSYQKAGFSYRTDKEEVLRKYYKPELFDTYKDGDYGFDITAVLTLE
ncbi:GNAT family N-acetyltransferase [Bacteroides sp.]|uniref:GNAT family N-acetyltransferase n=1 Tax=Bacteroides sp. TaxID=29523 RepID=UPI00261ACD0B|nr:GNAT family N-acetyltransferase [Bacteroides sp.]MDD3039504.1 GNAT family N-acetyltransferase [Bacteroides sp.]